MSQVNNEAWLQEMHTPAGLLRQKSKLERIASVGNMSPRGSVASPRGGLAMQSPRPHTPMSLQEFADVNSQVDEHLAAEQEKREKMQELMSKVGTFREASVCLGRPLCFIFPASSC